MCLCKSHCCIFIICDVCEDNCTFTQLHCKKNFENRQKLLEMVKNKNNIQRILKFVVNGFICRQIYNFKKKSTTQTICINKSTIVRLLKQRIISITICRNFTLQVAASNISEQERVTPAVIHYTGQYVTQLVSRRQK